MTNRNEVLLRWQTEEATVRARLAAAGVTSPQDLKASSGIEFLQRIFNGELPSPPIGETLGFVPIAAEPGRVVFQGTPDRRPAPHDLRFDQAQVRRNGAWLTDLDPLDRRMVAIGQGVW